MLATYNASESAALAITGFSRKANAAGHSRGSFTPDNLTDAILDHTGPARVMTLGNRLLIGNPNWQVVIDQAPNPCGNPRFFGFEVAHKPLVHLVVAGRTWWLEPVETAMLRRCEVCGG